jgi:hypothetical protein
MTAAEMQERRRLVWALPKGTRVEVRQPGRLPVGGFKLIDPCYSPTESLIRPGRGKTVRCRTAWLWPVTP